MEKNRAEKSPFSKIDQVGMVVKDMDKTVKYYESLGLGPFEAMDVTPVDRIMWGKPVPEGFKNLVRMVWIGPVQVELIQPVAEKSIYRDFLEKHGDGVQHVCCFVDDLEKEVANLVKKGAKVIYKGKWVGGGGFTYFDTEEVGGILFELVQWPTK